MATVGLITQIFLSMDVAKQSMLILMGACNAIWSTLFLEFWKRKEALFS